MKVRMVTASTPVTSYKLVTALENVFSVKFGAIVTENGNDVVVSIPFSDHWLELTRSLARDKDTPYVIAKVGVSTLPNAKPFFQYKSRAWITSAKSLEKEWYTLLDIAANTFASPELDKLLVKVKKALSRVLSKFDREPKADSFRTPVTKLPPAKMLPAKAPSKKVVRNEEE